MFVVAFLSIASSQSVLWAQEQQQLPGSTAGPSAEQPRPPLYYSIKLLTPADGVDFNRYLTRIASVIKDHWYLAMPEVALAGGKGKATVLFQVRSDGGIENVTLETTSGKGSLDEAAIKAIRSSSPVDPLPAAFKGSSIELRFVFAFNRPLDQPLPSACTALATGTPSAPPFDRLEFLAFAFANFDVPYAKRMICQRGIDFNPDSPTLQIFRINRVTPGLVETASNLKPRPASNPSPDRERAFATLQLALEDMRGGQEGAADVNFKRSIELAGDSATLHSAYALYLTKTHRAVEAEAQSRRSLELWQENADAHVGLAVELSLLGREVDAVSEARQALQIFPDHTGALVALGFALTRSGQYTEAIPILRKASVHAPNMTLIHKHLGGCLVHTRDFAAAIEQLNTFLKTAPDDAEAQYFLGVALRETNKKDEAQTHLREASRLDPDNPVYSTAATPPDYKPEVTDNSTSSEIRPDEGAVSGNTYSNTFFGFSYQFPKGWTVLDPRKNEFLLRMSGSVIANGDPILSDVSEAAARNSHSLLLVAKETIKGISATSTLISIQALDKRFAPHVKSDEELANSLFEVNRARGLAVSVIGSPEKVSIAGNQFWELKMEFSMKNAVSHGVEVVMIEKSYLLLFAFASVDASKLDDLVGTMQSLRFTNPRQ
jgi:TonB family protein